MSAQSVLFEYDLLYNTLKVLYTDDKYYSHSIVKINNHILDLKQQYTDSLAILSSFNCSSYSYNVLFSYKSYDKILNLYSSLLNELSIFKTCTNNTVFIKNKSISASDSTATTYQWVNCADNTDIVGANNYTYSPSSSGYYAVKINKNGCTSISTCIAFEITGIKEIENNSSLQIFPNPNNGSFIIKTTSYKSLQIINMMGQLVKQVDLKENNQTEINGLAPRMYFIKTENGAVLNKKIVVVN